MKIYKSINNKNIFTEDDINMPDQNSIINDITSSAGDVLPSADPSATDPKSVPVKEPTIESVDDLDVDAIAEKIADAVEFRHFIRNKGR